MKYCRTVINPIRATFLEPLIDSDSTVVRRTLRPPLRASPDAGLPPSPPQNAVFCVSSQLAKAILTISKLHYSVIEYNYFEKAFRGAHRATAKGET